jgi:tetratricopeptide (TPR) repeat protein
VCCKSPNRVLCFALLLITLAGCSKQRPSSGKIAILPFSNLSADPQLDWMSAGFAEILKAQLTGTPEVDPVSLKSPRDAPAVGAGAVLEGYFSVVSGRIRVEAVLLDSATNRARKTASASGGQSEIFGIANTIARKIEPDARAFTTGNEAALRAWLDALAAGETDAAGVAFERATAADPDFGAAWVSWAQWLVSRGDRDRAGQAIASARGRGARLGAVERARLDVISSALEGDRAAERRALVHLARATPADASLYRTLANLDLSGRAYPDAARWFDLALERDPENAALLNEAGYAHAYARDLEGAAKALGRYRDLRPRDANPLDSLGDVHFYLGRFAEAEKHYLEANAKDPAFLAGATLYKAAWARLMAGDLQGARDLFGRFVRARQEFGDAMWPYRAAQWDYVTGRRQEAVEELEKIAGQPGSPLAALATAQLSIWALESGDRDRARRFALRASPSAAALLCRFLTEPPAPAGEWSSRADKAFSQPPQAGIRRYALAYALLLSKDFAAAVPQLTEIYRQTPPSAPASVEVPLAWALLETGKIEEAGELLSVNPIPEVAGENLFLSLSFPRLLQLRGTVLEKQGRGTEAGPYFGMFQRLSRPAADSR